MGSCEDVDYRDILFVPNQLPPSKLGSSVQFVPSCEFRNPPPAAADPHPCPAAAAEQETSEDLSENASHGAVLAYINQFLLEDEEDESCPGAAAAQDSALLAVEKPFVDIVAGAEACRGDSMVNPWCRMAGNGGGLVGEFMSRQTSCEMQVVPCELGKMKEDCDVHRGRRMRRDDDGLELEDERRSKQPALCDEEVVREMFDKVLLCNVPNCELQSPLPADAEISGRYVKGSGNRRGRKKGKPGAAVEEDAVDLTTLLIRCAQATAIDDHRSSGELLKQIRQCSSALGDAGQRLAHYLANGLEARLAGAGSRVYRSLVEKRNSTGDILKAFKLYGTACPFTRIPMFCSNETILQASKGITSLHIIDYGIGYGFQWPVFMQRISKRTDGLPRIRITGIDLPRPGFRPAERVEATGRRLHEYARMFNLQFEYHPIAARWDTVKIEDLGIEDGEFLVVNCLFRMRHMMDETATDDSPRTRVLKSIRKMSPHLFIHGVVNGTYNAPFFVTRFKEALFFFSSLFDMLENASRVDEHRLLLERDLFGREALNVVACEGTERVERPESYKQWQARNLRAGFRQLQLSQDTVKKSRYKVSRSYHSDFFVDEDNKWMLIGWKGRVILAFSTWKPS